MAILPVRSGLSGKTPETLSELFLEFPSRVRLGPLQPYNSRHLNPPEHFGIPSGTEGISDLQRAEKRRLEKGDRFLSSAGAGGDCARPMRLPDPTPVLDKNRAPMGPEISSSTGGGVWREAPMAFPDSSSVLDKFQPAIREGRLARQALHRWMQQCANLRRWNLGAGLIQHNLDGFLASVGEQVFLESEQADELLKARERAHENARERESERDRERERESESNRERDIYIIIYL